MIDLALWVLLGLSLVVAAGAAAAALALGLANRVLLRSLVDAASPSGIAVTRLLDDRTLAAVGLPVLQAAGLLLASCSAALLLGVGGSAAGLPGPALLVVYISAVLLVSVVLPMVWAARNPESAVLKLARPLGWLAPLLRPSIAVFRLIARLVGAQIPEETRPISEEELRALVNIDDENGGIEEDEMEMIAGIIELGETKVREVMVPRIDMVAIPIDATLDEALDTIIRAGHSRIPVYRESIDDIAGLLYAKDLLRPFRDGNHSPKLSQTLREAHFVPDSKPVDELLQELQQRKVHMAIVVDEYGGTAGLVTIEDLLEEIVGEIQDEYDAEEPRIEEVGEDEVVFDAGIDIDDVNRMMDINLPTNEVDTLAGLVFTSLGKVPIVGERAEFEEADIEVLALAGRRIRRVRVLRRKDGSAEAENGAVSDGAAAE